MLPSVICSKSENIAISTLVSCWGCISLIYQQGVFLHTCIGAVKGPGLKKSYASLGATKPGRRYINHDIWLWKGKGKSKAHQKKRLYHTFLDDKTLANHKNETLCGNTYWQKSLCVGVNSSTMNRNLKCDLYIKTVSCFCRYPSRKYLLATPLCCHIISTWHFWM